MGVSKIYRVRFTTSKPSKFENILVAVFSLQLLLLL